MTLLLMTVPVIREAVFVAAAARVAVALIVNGDGTDLDADISTANPFMITILRFNRAANGGVGVRVRN